MSRTVVQGVVVAGVLAFLLVAGCPGERSTGVAGPAPAFTGYTTNPATYALGEAIAPNVPVVEGKVDGFTIEPALPDGLALDAATGEITGTPRAPIEETAFLVTARRGQQSDSTTLYLTIRAPLVTIVANQPLVASFASPAAPVALTGASLGTVPDGPLAAGAPPATDTANVAPTADATAPPEPPPPTTGAGSPGLNATDPFTAFVSVSAEHLGSSPALTPTLEPPYASIAPALPGFPFPSHAPAPGFVEGSLRLRLTPAGVAGLSYLSNAIPTHRFVVRQVSTGQNLTSTSSGFEHQGTLYFRSVNANAKDKVFAHDLASLSLRQLADTTGAANNDGSRVLGSYGAKLLLRLRNNASQKRTRLYAYDPSSDSLACLISTYPGGSDEPDAAIALGDSLYFASRVNGSASKLFRLQSGGPGGADALSQLSNTSGAGQNDGPASPVALAGRLYFAARLPGGARKLFRFDPNDPSRVQQIADTSGGPLADDDPGTPVAVQGKLYFAARNPHGARKLYRYDESAHRVEQIVNLRADAIADDAPGALAEWNGRLFFVGSPLAGIQKLYRYDPATGALQQASDTAGAGADDAPSAPTGLGGSVYFAARNPSGTRKLYRFEDSTARLTQLTNLRSDASAGDDPLGMTAYAGRLWFSGLRASGVRKLYAYDPGSDEVFQAANTRGNDASNDGIQILGVFGAHLSFAAIPAAGGSPQLFRLCDGATGCAE